MKIYHERPEKLELTEEQVRVVSDAFLASGSPEALARALFERWNRISFEYFLVPRDPPKGAEGPDAEAAPEEPPRDYGFEFRPPVLDAEGLDILYAVMLATGAIVPEDGRETFIQDHPLTKKLVESAKFEIPERMQKYA